jgi:F-type H+-transporting ATPase subunit delta
MTTADRIDAYAAALFEVARAEGQTGDVEDELFRFAHTFESNDSLREALTDQRIPAERRQAIVEELLANRASPVTANLVSFVVGAGRGRDLPDIIDRLVARAAEARQHEVAEVTSAIPLDDEQQRRLAVALGNATKKKVEIRLTVDPEILGGIVARIGDTVIDGSVRHRLDLLKEKL